MTVIGFKNIAAIAFATCNIAFGQSWYREDPSTAPPARRFHGMAFDAARAVTVLFGGVDERRGLVFGDTWEFDGADWSLRSQQGPARQRFAACADRARGTFVVFGGMDAGGALLDDTWQWNGTSWARVATTRAPAPRADAEMVFDAARRRVVLFGGRPADASQPFGDTWEFDGSDWMQLYPTAAPDARHGHAMAFDSARGVTVLFGGFVLGASGTSVDTWEYDGIGWREVAAATPPPSSVFPSLAFHSGHGVAVLTGAGGAATQPIQTFAFDGIDWQAGPAAPAELVGRQGHASAYDDVRDAVVLYGGASVAIGGALPRDDTWELSEQASFTPFGASCSTRDAGYHLRPLALQPLAGARPEIGRDFTLELAPLRPAALPVLLLGLDDQHWAGVPLPLDLSPFGLLGCRLFVSIEAVAVMTQLGTVARRTLMIPLDKSLLAREVLVQALLQGGELATSNAGRLRLGN